MVVLVKCSERVVNFNCLEIENGKEYCCWWW